MATPSGPFPRAGVPEGRPGRAGPASFSASSRWHSRPWRCRRRALAECRTSWCGTKCLRRDPAASAEMTAGRGSWIRPAAPDLGGGGSPGPHSFLRFDLRRLQTLGGDASPPSPLSSSSSTRPVPPRGPGTVSAPPHERVSHTACRRNFRACPRKRRSHLCLVPAARRGAGRSWGREAPRTGRARRFPSGARVLEADAVLPARIPASPTHPGCFTLGTPRLPRPPVLGAALSKAGQESPHFTADV